MKTLIKKEIRLLLPAWITALLLAIIPRVFVILYASPGEPQYFQNWLSFIAGLIFAIGLLFLGINSFGQELSCNTFSALLSHPMKRPRVWLIKVATLAAAFVSVWLVGILFASCQLSVYQWNFQRNVRPDLSGAVEFLTLSALVAFSGGLWTTLLLRQITTAFWFTLLAPLAIIWGISSVFQDRLAWGIGVDAFIAAALVLYSTAGFFLARRLFMRAQDVQWTGGELSLSLGGGVSKTSTGWLPVRTRHWFSALALKELQLHQGTFLIAAIVLALHVSTAFIRKLHLHDSDLQFFLENFWMLWLLMPILIGAAAIAEERRLGILEPQLCLPVSRSAQLFFKFSSALILSLFFGALIPVLIEGIICGAGVSDTGLWVIAEHEMMNSIGTFNQWHWVAILAGAIFFVSFYASSLARTALQGIGLTFLVALAIYIYAITTGFWPGLGFYYNPHSGIAILERYLGAPILLLVLAWLTFSNFKHVHQNRRFWARNFTAILLVFICVPFLARAVYVRPWELLMQLEPRGSIRITNPTQVKFGATSDGVYAISPNGQLWFEHYTYGIPQIVSGSGQFAGESNWVDVAVNEVGGLALAVQSNGTLWSIGGKIGSATMTQIGADNDWSQVAGGFTGFLVLKKDGSLWGWGIHHYDWNGKSKSTGARAQNSQRDLASLPVRVSDDTNWTALYSTHLFSPYARNKSGTIWLWMGKRMIQETNVDNQWLSLQFGNGLSYAEVRTNGDLYYLDRTIIIQRPGLLRSLRGPPSLEQLDEPSKWTTAAFGPINGWQTVMAIRNDGTLWKFLYPQPPRFTMGTPVQLGTRSDWVAVSQGFSLASDGSIWTWNQSSKYSWLAPSRQPVCVGNIFDGN